MDVQPQFKGDTFSICGFDGFFATREGKPLYCIGSYENRVVCLVSYDDGDIWHDYARSDQTFNVYSLGGCRRITDDGYIIGSFTDARSATTTIAQDSRAYFLRIKTP
jgi:hypothetical protein